MKLATIQNFLQKNWQFTIVVFLAILFFFTTSSFNYLTQSENFVKWSSPDETANYFFTNLYATSGTLTVKEKYNEHASNIIMPRSFRSDETVLKPVSFLGIMLIYGKIASWTSPAIIPFLTPLFAAIGIIFYYLLVRRLFSQNVAFASAILLSFFPVYIYYSARSMFHNVLFVVLLIIGIYFALQMSKSNKLKTCRTCFYSALSGIAIGLAIITRTSELIWLAPTIFFLWAFNFKKIGVVKSLHWLSFVLLTFLPIFHWNQVLYGSYLQGGYPEMNQTIINIVDSGVNFIKSITTNQNLATEELNSIGENIFYFGFKSYESFMNFVNYFFVMFVLIAAPAILGTVLMSKDWKNLKHGHRIFLFLSLFITAVLVFYYGSWKFNDNPDASQITIGNSYTRYWLPIYLCAIPLAYVFIERFTKEIFNKDKKPTNFGNILPSYKNNSFVSSLTSINNAGIKNWKLKIEKILKPLPNIAINQFEIRDIYFINALRTLFVGIIVFTSFQFVLFGSDEGLIQSYYKQKNAQIEYERVLSLTEDNSVIITLYHDKLFFPQRRVIVGLFDDKNMIANYSKLAKIAPLYYYNFTLPQKSVDYLNNRRLKENSLQIEKITTIGDFSLYKLTSIDWDTSACYGYINEDGLCVFR